MRYEFREAVKCNMCASPSAGHRIIGRRMNRSQGINPRGKAGVSVSVLRCRDCGLIYPNPMPLPERISDHYGVPPAEYWKPEYFRANCGLYEYEIDIFKKLSSSPVAGMRALDAGCGVGKYMKELASSGFDVFGLEPSEPFYRAAIEAAGIQASRLQMASIENGAYDEDFFDFINLSAVLEHLPDPSGAITRAMKWLKPSGFMHIEAPSTRWLTGKIMNGFYRVTGADYVSNLSPMHNPYHLYEFSLKAFEKNAARSGYSVVKSEYYVGQTFLPGIVDFAVKPFMKLTGTGMQISAWLRKGRR